MYTKHAVDALAHADAPYVAMEKWKRLNAVMMATNYRMTVVPLLAL